MILAVDLGNYNIKTSEGIIFFSAYSTEEAIMKDYETILEYQGESYIIGKGHFDNEFDKTKKEYLPNLLTAIGLSTNDVTVDLILGCPIIQSKQKKLFKDQLEGKTFKFTINGNKKEAYIRRLATVPEGVSSFYVLDPHLRRFDVLIVDIGGRTINVVSFVNQKIEKSITIPFGMIDFYKMVQEKENSNGNSFNVEDIERLIKSGFIKSIENEKKAFLKKILNSIKLTFNIATYRVYFTGGGSITLLSVLENQFDMLVNPIFSNCKGNQNIALAKWGVK